MPGGSTPHSSAGRAGVGLVVAIVERVDIAREVASRKLEGGGSGRLGGRKNREPKTRRERSRKKWQRAGVLHQTARHQLRDPRAPGRGPRNRTRPGAFLGDIRGDVECGIFRVTGCTFSKYFGKDATMVSCTPDVLGKFHVG